MFRFPFSTLHELNLDWILDIVKRLKESNDEFNKKADYAVTTADDAKRIAEQAAQAQVADGAVTTPKLAENAVTTPKIIDGAVTATKLASNSVTATKIANNAVTNAKLAAKSVSKSKFDEDLGISFTSVLSGEKISIIGDSISTWNEEGYKVDGYAQLYPDSRIPDVTTVYDTWWKKVIESCGCTLEVNASYSGSRVTNTDPNRPSFYARCSTAILGSPETILVQMGTNDSNNSVAIGPFDFSTDYIALSEATFATAYIKGIKALQTLYPNAQIVCVILAMTTGYARAIQRIAVATGCHYVFCDKYAREFTSHPNALGMRQIASAVMAMRTWDDGSNNNKQIMLPDVAVENGNLVFIDDDITIGTSPSSNHSGRFVAFRDSNYEVASYIRHDYNTSKEVGLKINASNRNANNQNLSNSLTLIIGEDGSQRIVVSSPEAWRRALGLVYANNNTFTVGNGVIMAGFITNARSSVRFTVQCDQSLEDISSVTVTAATGYVRGNNGYLDGSSIIDFTNGYTITASKVSNKMVQVTIDKSTEFTNSVNNTPVAAIFSNLTLKFNT